MHAYLLQEVRWVRGQHGQREEVTVILQAARVLVERTQLLELLPESDRRNRKKQLKIPVIARISRVYAVQIANYNQTKL